MTDVDDLSEPDRPSQGDISRRGAAQALINEALARLGLDSETLRDAEGWCHVRYRATEGTIGIAQWDRERLFLVVASMIMPWPDHPRLQIDLAEALLRLNHQRVDTARFSLHDDHVSLADVRPIDGLTVDAILTSLRLVMGHAADLGVAIRGTYDLAPPRVALDDVVWRSACELFGMVSTRAQHVFRDLIEQWHARGGGFRGSDHTLTLLGISHIGTLAALIGNASAGPIVTVSWHGLERTYGVQRVDADAFRAAVPRPAGFEITKSSAHLPVEVFTSEMVPALIEALVLLDEAMARAVKPEPPPVPDLRARWGLEVQVGKATQRNIDAVLAICPEHVRPVYIQLIQGWHDAGQPVYSNQPNLVYLRLTVDKSTFALATLRPPGRTRGANVNLPYPMTYHLDGYPEARRHFEQNVARCRGFQVHNSGARIMLDEPMSEKELRDLMHALLELAGHVSPKAP